MKKRTRIILSICAVVICAVSVLLFIPNSGTKTLYFPETIIVNKIENGIQKSQPLAVITVQYNSSGFPESVDISGVPNGSQTISCDDNGNVVSVMGNLQVADVISTYNNEYFYSSDGKIKRIDINNGIASWTRLEQTYNLNGQLKKKRIALNHQKGGYVDVSREYNTTYTYSFGKLVSSKCEKGTRVDRLLFSTTDYLYDSNGQLSQEIRRDSTGKIVVQVDYHYENGNTVATSTSYNDYGTHIRTYIFDHTGNLIYLSFGNNSVHEYTFTYTYRQLEVPVNSPRNSFVYLYSLPQTGISDQNWVYLSNSDEYLYPE